MCADCTELHLANRGIDKLADFHRFANLECLWLNGNCLAAVEGLDTNFRLQELYIHDNLISTLAGSLGVLSFLRVLDASNNKLSKLRAVLQYLSKLHFVESLNLSGNACCQETGYREAVIKAMPSLCILDNLVVSTAERKGAQVCWSICTPRACLQVVSSCFEV